MIRGERSKASWRRTMERRLAALEPTAAQAAAEAVGARAAALPLVTRASTVLCCLSFGSEFETRPTIERLLASGHRVCLPRCVEGTRRLTVHPYPCALEKLPFGLEQPTVDSPAVAASAIEVALLVGLAFDHRGFRLGHGGGYFDRFLAAHEIAAVGLAHEAQVIDRLPVDRHDIPMALVITAGNRYPADAATG